jgi:hypothetical protein
MPSLLPQPSPDKLLEAVRIKEKFNEIFGGDEMTMPQVLHEKQRKEKRPRASSLKSALIEP